MLHRNKFRPQLAANMRSHPELRTQEKTRWCKRIFACDGAEKTVGISLLAECAQLTAPEGIKDLHNSPAHAERSIRTSGYSRLRDITLSRVSRSSSFPGVCALQTQASELLMRVPLAEMTRAGLLGLQENDDPQRRSHYALS